jgi:hypothetical protein
MDIQPTQRTLAPTLKSHPPKKKKNKPNPYKTPLLNINNKLRTLPRALRQKGLEYQIHPGASKSSTSWNQTTYPRRYASGEGRDKVHDKLLP